MIVGFDASRAFSDKRTGTENYSYQLLKALAKIDRKNTYIVFLRPGTIIPPFVPPLPSLRAKRGNLDLGLNQDSYDPIKSDLGMTSNYGWPSNFQFKVINWPKLWTQGGLSLQTFKDKLDVLFVPSHTLPLIRKPGLKTVVTVHDLGSEYLPQMHQLKQRLYLSLMQNYQLKFATKIIAVSNATKEDLIKKIGINSASIDVVYEGFDKDLYKKLSNDTIVNRLRHYELRTNNYFLFVGTVQPRKNLERVIIAFSLQLSAIRQKHKKSDDRRLMTDSYLVIAGSKGWLSDEIYKLPKKLGIEDKVKFLGYVPDKDLPVLYNGALAFLYPSLFEGFGLPILEAQACGCPVITSNISSMPEVASDAAILIDPYSVEDIVKGMERVMKHDARSMMQEAGFENIKGFSWEKTARETLKVLEEASHQ